MKNALRDALELECASQYVSLKNSKKGFFFWNIRNLFLHVDCEKLFEKLGHGKLLCKLLPF